MTPERAGAPLPIALSAMRTRRIKQVLGAYWAITLAIGLLLPHGPPLQAMRELIRGLVEPLSGIEQVASISFDRAFVEVFFVVSFTTAIALWVIACFTVPAGSLHAKYPSVGKKLWLSFLVALMCAAALTVPLVTQSSIGLAEGRAAALLSLGASSKLGVLTILNTVYGFAQLFFLLALRAAATTPVMRFRA